MPHDPVSGPIPREEFDKLIDAPYGEATKRIRRFDPLYGRAPGDLIKWKVTFMRDIVEEGIAYVQAATEEEAEELAEKLNDADVSWDVIENGGRDIDSVEPTV